MLANNVIGLLRDHGAASASARAGLDLERRSSAATTCSRSDQVGAVARLDSVTAARPRWSRRLIGRANRSLAADGRTSHGRRRRGGSPDIGAYEYGAAPGT